MGSSLLPCQFRRSEVSFKIWPGAPRGSLQGPGCPGCSWFSAPPASFGSSLKSLLAFSSCSCPERDSLLLLAARRHARLLT